MCECGCGEMRPIVKFPAPGGKWYMVEFYPGCTNCQNGFAAMSVYLVEEGDDFGTIEHTPDADFGRYGQWATHVLAHKAMREVFRKENGDDEFSEANFAFDEFLARGGLIESFYLTERTGSAETSSP